MDRPNLIKGAVCVIIAAVFAYCGPAFTRTIQHVNPSIETPPPRPPESQQTDFHKLGSWAVIEAFKENGLEAEVTPGLTIGAVAAKESVIFLLPSYGSDIGGVVSGYDSEDKLNGAAGYYSSMNKDPGTPAWRIFRKDNILLLISGRVPEEKAREYERVLKEMGER